jgi:pre-mRNA-splicing factor ATP-dependent RNA helicase DHX15/PRP43
LDDYRKPEILRKPYHETLLRLKVTNRSHLKFVDHPSETEIKRATKLLIYLGALDDNEEITELGKQIAKLPVSPEMGKALITSCDLKCSEDMCKIAAMCTVGFYIFKHKVLA